MHARAFAGNSGPSLSDSVELLLRQLEQCMCSFNNILKTHCSQLVRRYVSQLVWAGATDRNLEAVPSSCKSCFGGDNCFVHWLRGCLYGRRDGTFAWTERKRDLVMHVYISYLSRSVYMERILPGCFSSRPSKVHGITVRSTGIPTKAGQFLSYKHSCSVPLRRDDIMLTLQIVPGEIVPGRNILM